jgi:hypothetical protein
MPNQLLESDFLTVSLKSLLAKQKSSNTNSTTETDTYNNGTKTAEPEKDFSSVTDWGKELQDRLTKNNSLDETNRKSDDEVEADFFNDYFVYGDKSWDAEAASKLRNLGAPFQRVLKVLGFDKKTNPILGFVIQPHVVKKLLLPGLLNSSTFRAIYEAIVKKLVADSELFVKNDYNIIYCQDLYKKSASEMIKYLNMQKNVLSPTASVYTKADQEKNKKTFFYIKAIKEQDINQRRAAIAKLPTGTSLPIAYNASTTLNSMAFITAFIGIQKGSAAGNNTKQTSTSRSAANIAGKIKSKEQAFAAIQYLGAITGASEALKALQHSVFNDVSAGELAKATAQIVPFMKKAQLPEEETKSFINRVLDGLELEK